MKQVVSVEQLRILSHRENGDFVQFYLILGGGIARSGKRISYRPKEKKNWLVINEIDDSYQELNDQSIAKKTMIIESIEKGTLFLSEI